MKEILLDVTEEIWVWKRINCLILGYSMSCEMGSIQFSCSVRHNPICDPMDCSMPGFPVHHQLPVCSNSHSSNRISFAVSINKDVTTVCDSHPPNVNFWASCQQAAATSSWAILTNRSLLTEFKDVTIISDYRALRQVPEKNMYFCFIDYAKAFDCVDHNQLWKILKEMVITRPPDLPLEKSVCSSGSNS